MRGRLWAGLKTAQSVMPCGQSVAHAADALAAEFAATVPAGFVADWPLRDRLDRVIVPTRGPLMSDAESPAPSRLRVANALDALGIAADIVEFARADAAFVRERTGFAIGGVAPVGHVGAVTVLVDRALWRLDPIWAAAGTHNAVFRLSADDLHRIAGIRVVDVRQGS